MKYDFSEQGKGGYIYPANHPRSGHQQCKGDQRLKIKTRDGDHAFFMVMLF